MKSNVGKIDKVIRITLGLLIGALGYYYKSWWGLVGLVPILTSIISWCPLYVPFGIKTSRRN